MDPGTCYLAAIDAHPTISYTILAGTHPVYPPLRYGALGQDYVGAELDPRESHCT